MQLDVVGGSENNYKEYIKNGHSISHFELTVMFSSSETMIIFLHFAFSILITWAILEPMTK